MAYPRQYFCSVDELFIAHPLAAGVCLRLHTADAARVDCQLSRIAMAAVQIRPYV